MPSNACNNRHFSGCYKFSKKKRENLKKLIDIIVALTSIIITLMLPNIENHALVIIIVKLKMNGENHDEAP